MKAYLNEHNDLIIVIERDVFDGLSTNEFTVKDVDFMMHNLANHLTEDENTLTTIAELVSEEILFNDFEGVEYNYENIDDYEY